MQDKQKNNTPSSHLFDVTTDSPVSRVPSFATKSRRSMYSRFVMAALLAAVATSSWQYFAVKSDYQASLAYQATFEAELTKQNQAVQTQLEQLAQAKETIQNLENYLSERGVKVSPSFEKTEPNKPNKAAGGPLDTQSVVSFLQDDGNKQLDSLENALHHTPLGYPHHGKITSTFGHRANPFSGQGKENHGGTDFKGNVGDAVKSTANGTVIFAGTQGGYGNLIQVRHGYGYVTYYGHLSAINVKVGQKITAGDVIGKVGSTGRSTGPHLHYEVRKNDQRLDPVAFLAL